MCRHLGGRLLPHLFTLARQTRTGTTGGCFLLRYHDLAAIFPLGSAALCVARTFLPPLAGTAVEPASAGAKIVFFGRTSERSGIIPQNRPDRNTGRKRQGRRKDSPAPMLSQSVIYQIITRSSSGMNILPSVMAKASKKVGMLRSVASTRHLPSECTSSLVRRAISSSRIFCAHSVA